MRIKRKDTAFEACGYRFGPKPEGWESFKLVESSASERELYLVGVDCLGETHSVVIRFTYQALGLALEGWGCLVRETIQSAFTQFRPQPLDALDILRAAQ